MNTHKSNRSILYATLVMVSVAACGDNLGFSDAGPGGDDASSDASSLDAPGVPTVPTVIATTPLDTTNPTALNTTIDATFSEAMDPATLTTTTFTLRSGVSTPVLGQVTASGARVLFQPNARLASNSVFTATITSEAKSGLGVALAASYSWTFTTGLVTAAEPVVNLGTSGNFAILTKSGISTVPSSMIVGDLGVSPISATAITGFSLIMDPSNQFSKSAQVTGKVFAATYAQPTPAKLTTAIGDMQLAFTDAASRPADVTELGAGNIGGLILVPGVYKWGTGVLVPTNVTLSGSATDVWIFEIAQTLTLSSNAQVVLVGGALPKNVFWQASGKVTLNTGAHIEGNVLAKTAISLETGSSINGRLLAQTAVTLNQSTITIPAN